MVIDSRSVEPLREVGPNRADGGAGATDSAEAVDAAIACVLQAERAAAAAVAATQQAADATREQAREQARRIDERARERLARARHGLERQVQLRLLELQQRTLSLPAHDEPDAAALALLQAAVRRLAAGLTGADRSARAG